MALALAEADGGRAESETAPEADVNLENLDDDAEAIIPLVTAPVADDIVFHARVLQAGAAVADADNVSIGGDDSNRDADDDSKRDADDDNADEDVNDVFTDNGKTERCVAMQGAGRCAYVYKPPPPPPPL
jgi:hypothetical protein